MIQITSWGTPHFQTLQAPVAVPRKFGAPTSSKPGVLTNDATLALNGWGCSVM